MRIQDIISEAGLGQAVGGVAKGVGAAAGAAAGAAQMAHQGFKTGQDKMDKLLNPKRWFEKNKGGEKNVVSSGTTAPHENRRILQQAGQARPLYLKDKQDLKILHRGIIDGNISTNLDQTQLSLALKAAYTGQPLNKDQQALLMQFSKQF